MLKSLKTEKFKNIHLNFYKHIVIASLLGLGTFLACDPIEEEISSDSTLRLTASTDTVTFDTLFSSVGSITKRFRLFNPNENAIELDRIYLGRGSNSPYALTVNGERGTTIESEVILGKDSLLVLVDVTIDPNEQNLPFLVKDSVVISFNGNTGDIKLVAWGQDAIFLNHEVIDCDAVWDAKKPYVLSDTLVVASDCSLTIEAGTKIYFDNNGVLIVLGNLDVKGTAENKVVFRNSRLDNQYDVAPGQWQGIFFYPGSINNIIDHAVLENGMNGLTLLLNLENNDGAELNITNSSIRHMSNTGLSASNGIVNASNLEIYNCATHLLANGIGGQYQYDHCTFSNYPSLFSRDNVSVAFSNVIRDDNGVIVHSLDLDVKMTNSIIWGGEKEELGLDIPETSQVIIETEGNIFRSEDESWVTLGNTISILDNYPGFYSSNAYNYQLDSLSNARDASINSIATHDLLGTMRDAMPDIGAYERKDSIQ